VADHRIAAVVAESVVDRLEQVDVEHHQRQRPPVARAKRLVGAHQEVTAVAQAGEVVSGGEPLELLCVAHQLATQHEQLAIGRLGALAHRALVFQPAGDAAAQMNGEHRNDQSQHRDGHEARRTVRHEHQRRLRQQQRVHGQARGRTQISGNGAVEISREHDRAEEECSRHRHLDVGAGEQQQHTCHGKREQWRRYQTPDVATSIGWLHPSRSRSSDGISTADSKN